jgi:hypothetical protein
MATQLTTVRAGGNVLHTNPEGNRHSVCGRVSVNKVYGPDAAKGLVAGTLRFCGNCARVRPARNLNPTPVSAPSDMWTVTNKAGDEIERFYAVTTAEATEYIRVSADCRDWFRLEGGVSRRRLYSHEL